MTGRLRYLLAAAFVALFFLIPSADQSHLAFLKARAWLTQEGGVFDQLFCEERDGKYVQVHPVPPLLAVIQHQEQQEWIPEYERIVREWARGKRHRMDGGLRAMQLQVVVGDQGFRCDFLAAVDGRAVEKRLEITAQAADDYLPDRYSLLPAFLAIVLAILTARVIPALLLGCLAGAWLYRDGLVDGSTHLFGATIWGDVLTDTFSIEIMGFVIFLFMCVGVMTRAGGIQGMVDLIRRFARGPISSQLCSYAIGILIFFDDYSNCVITGTTMRPLTDRNRVSREKLSYIVDSTAAPIAGVSIFSTWVAYEVSMFAPQLPEVTNAEGVPYERSEGFSVFVQTLPFRFYCLFTLVMVLLTILMRREFGSMLSAERRAARDGKAYEDDAAPMVSSSFEKLDPPPETRCLARNALVPIGVLVVLTLTLIFTLGHHYATLDGADLDSGWRQTIATLLEKTQSQKALFWASLSALVIASLMAMLQRILSFKEVVVSALRSAVALAFAVIILILAWTIGNICKDVGTSEFLTAAFGNSFSPWLLPALLFMISSLVAFSTGTSYGTMAILLPNVVVLAHTMGQQSNIGGPAMMLLTIGAVLEGSIFGDHCSPISDTTVLSSVATGSDHLHHVRTQAPYAVFVMIISMLCGYLPMALFGTDYWPVSWLVGIAVLVGWLRFVGRSPDSN